MNKRNNKESATKNTVYDISKKKRMNPIQFQQNKEPVSSIKEPFKVGERGGLMWSYRRRRRTTTSSKLQALGDAIVSLFRCLPRDSSISSDVRTRSPPKFEALRTLPLETLEFGACERRPETFQSF